MPGNIQSTPPPSVLASWPQPNYVNPVERTWMPAYAGVLQAVTTILVSLRLGLRLRNKAGSLGLDDVRASQWRHLQESAKSSQVLLIPAFLTSTMFTILIMLTTIRYKSGRHVWDVPLQDYQPIALVGWIAELAYLVSTSATKVSVLLFYRRLVSSSVDRRWRWATQAAIAFTICYCLGFMLSLIFACRPLDSYWKAFSPYYTKSYDCADSTVANPLSGALSVFSDFYSVILPMMIMRNLEIDRRKRIAMNIVFSFGLLVVGAGVVRTYYLTRLGSDYDSTWIGYNVYIWADLETQLAIICASAPVLRVLFRRYLRMPLSRAMYGGGSVKLDESVAQGHIDRASVQSPVEKGFRQSLNTFEEQDIDSKRAALQDEEQAISTPEEFEQYALQSLEKYRTASHRQTAVAQHRSEASAQTSSDAVGEMHTPKSWLDFDTRR